MTFFFFSLGVGKKAVLTRKETQKCHHAVDREEEGGPYWNYVCVSVTHIL